MKELFLLIAFLGLTACSMEAHIFSGDSQTFALEPRLTPDLVVAEIATSHSGKYQVQAAFGEITENKSLANDYEIQAVFYQ
ncbi:MAG: hypothetical protein OM95_14065 [Bdellovibrio sp. ArHS]|uniref:hypothetical protein n=1 Tax=Bdellovibrio sp. ArHS TaxID=1569284 RepID=UPI000582ABF6|nr:hypothetical protein [Bdellovibrio sp. ArHS]KHD87492.1 MAG: hypothetical protein OM95_14065 [Bdellovibrio sp. ArHS]